MNYLLKFLLEAFHFHFICLPFDVPKSFVSANVPEVLEYIEYARMRNNSNISFRLLVCILLIVFVSSMPPDTKYIFGTLLYFSFAFRLLQSNFEACLNGVIFKMDVWPAVKVRKRNTGMDRRLVSPPTTINTCEIKPHGASHGTPVITIFHASLIQLIQSTP